MKKLLVLFLSILVLLGGCSHIGSDVQDLMIPPQLTENEVDIQKAISENIGKDTYIFKYPQRGEYRSAVITYDINNDGIDEAIVFYKLNYIETTDINMMIMNQVNGKWNQLAVFNVPSSEIDRVMFKKLHGGNCSEVIIGYKLYNTNINNNMMVLKYDNENIKLLDLKYTYSDFVTMDFDNDGLEEILLLSLSTQDKDAVARLIKYSDISDKLENIGQTQLSSAAIKYEAFSSGFIQRGQVGVVVDSTCDDNNMISEVIYWDNKKSVLETHLTEREKKTLSKDIDNDSIIDIPLILPMMGFIPFDKSDIENNIKINNEKDEENCYITQWSNYDLASGDFIAKQDMVINEHAGYHLIVPTTWEKNVSGKIDYLNNSLTFSEWISNPDGTGTLGSAILKIKVFSDFVWNFGIEDTSDFYEITRAGEKVYAVSILQPDNPNSMTLEQIKAGFGLGTFESVK